MDRSPYCCRIVYGCDRQRAQEIVDDGTQSSYPASLFVWLWIRLSHIEPVNNITYTPTLPPAA